MLVSEALDLIAMGLATATASATLSRAMVFKPAREYVAKRSAWAGRLVRCTYCTSHWVAAALIINMAPNGLIEGLVGWLITIALAAIGTCAIDRAYFMYKEEGEA